MKATNQVRKIDDLGRISIPIKVRNQCEIKTNDPLEIQVDGDSIILQKYKEKCVFCRNSEYIMNFKGKNVCKECINIIKG